MADAASTQDQAQQHTFDLVVLGGGTGGYVAAIRAKQLGLNVAVVEELKLGGTCLHRGCIPTKAFLKSADVFDEVKKAKEFGINIGGEISFDYETALGRSLKVVDGQYKGLLYLFDKKHRIPVFMGRGRMLNPTQIRVEPNDKSAAFTLRTRDVIVNTGSRPRPIKGVPYDGERVINSDHAVILEQLPPRIIVRGGGATGVEWASIYHRYGAKVTLVGRIVPHEDHEVAEHLQRAFQRSKMDLAPEARPTAEDIDVSPNGVTMRLTDAKGKERVVEADVLLVGIGRQGNIEEIGLEESGIKTEGEYIPVDPMMQTNVPHVYAIGDVNGQQLLAHTAMHQGIIAVEHICGKNPYPLDILNSPACTYCEPEIGSVGLTEREAQKLGHTVKVGKFPMRPNAKAVIEGRADGFTKMVADADTDDLLGVHIIGPHATELIAEAALGRLLQTTPEEIALNVHPHPTVSEVMGEAAHDLLGHAIHI
ncbi:MAG: Dihydrolipoamide dehydrogenase of branched-chain alpha-keto acid dehydrogenase [uncultured Thermomicrobiales bacterium]|uniref:Dihydrolipoyl dehydrogenase n=1 Tax=uncultured Thermomicrobiales bacterium TaxID=1645740 RepID=A0A6J4V0F8_9BACT|nr:MAG: Dihydrolipoamide dehydrogenase of branched-chain alpha-keto acid dehydrogenase [uncultured Thermomicrobiales bacterium]